MLCHESTMNTVMRLFFSGLVAAAVAMPASHAQTERPTPDGIYKPTELEAHVTLAGKRLNLPIKALRNALLRDGLIVVRDQRVRIQKSKWGPVLEKFNFLGIKGNASVTAPDNLIFKRSQTGKKDRFSAKLPYPLRISMKGRYKWVPVTVRMQTPLNSTIKNETLQIDAPLSVSVLKITATGSLRMTAERKYPLPPTNK
jgi:hypothetical protein